MTDAFDALLRPVLRRTRGTRAGHAVPGERDPRSRDSARSGWNPSPSTTCTSVVSRPSTAINRALIEAIRSRIAERGENLPVYFGNRNWHPFVEDTVAQMQADGVRRAAVFTTSAWGGYSGCTQYQEDIARARAAIGRRRPRHGQAASVLRPSAVGRDVRRRRRRGGRGVARRRCAHDARLVFTAHSIPLRAVDRCGPSLYPRQVALLVEPGRRGRRVRRLRRGVAVAVRAPAGAVAGTRCRPITLSALAEVGGASAVIVVPGRVRRRPHRGDLGSRQRTRRAGRRRSVSRWPGPPPPTPSPASPGSHWTCSMRSARGGNRPESLAPSLFRAMAPASTGSSAPRTARPVPSPRLASCQADCRIALTAAARAARTTDVPAAAARRRRSAPPMRSACRSGVSPALTVMMASTWAAVDSTRSARSGAWSGRR